MHRTLPAVLACVIGMLVQSTSASAAATARYIRIEAPTSLRMAIDEIEAHSGGKNILERNQEVRISGTQMRGEPLPSGRNQERGMIDGKIGARPYLAGAPPENSRLNPWIEFDLGREYPVERLVIHQPVEPAYLDRYFRLVSLLDGNRKVVLARTFDNRTKEVKDGVITIAANNPGNVPALLGAIVPPNANFWASMGKVVPVLPAPPPADAEARLARFQARNTPEGIRALASQFASVIDLERPELAEVKAKWQAGDAQGMLDAYRDHFFRKLDSAIYMRENRLGIRYTGTNYPGRADDLLDGLVVSVSQKNASGRAYTPGAFDWAYVPADGSEEQRVDALSVARTWANVNAIAGSLLIAYVDSGDVRYLQRWGEMTDDWAMHFGRDADASPYNVRDYFPKDPLQYFYYTCYQLKEFAKQRPELVQQMPSASLVRMLMFVVEEYPAQYWRQARVLAFNHMYNAFEAAYPCSQILNDFHAGQRFEREVAQDFERIWSMKMTRDGSMIEAGDEGHMTMPLSVARSYLDMTLAPPAWLGTELRARAENGIRSIYAYALRNMSPSGHDQRYADADAFPRSWELTKNPQVFKGGERVTAWQPLDFFADPEVRALYDTVYGRGATPTGEDRKAAQEQVIAFFKGDYQGPPKMVSDWMPYIGFHYLRLSWEPDAAFMHIMGQRPTNPSSSGQHWNTEYHYSDFGYPLLAAAPLTVDGQEQDPDFGRQTWRPGSKTSRITEAPRDPLPTRWHTSQRYDFAETFFEGTYQSHKIERNRNWAASPFSPPPSVPKGEPVHGVKATRQYIQIRPYRLFVITDRVELQNPGETHQYDLNYAFQVAHPAQPRNSKEPPPAGPAGKVTPEPAQRRIELVNPASPGVTVHHFATHPIEYGRSNWDYSINFRGRNYPGVGRFEQSSAVAQWRARGNNALVTLLESHRDANDRRVARIERVVNANNAAGFKAAMQDGGSVSYQAANNGVQQLSLDGIEARAEALLIVRAGSGETTGMVVGAQAMTANGRPVTIRSPNFEFRVDGQQVVAVAPIQQPIVPVRVVPDTKAFVDSVEVTLSTPTPDVEIRYTTDGTNPTADSTLYTGPFTITDSTVILARAFRKGVKEIPFTTAGTEVSAISYGSFRKEPYREPATVAQLTSGLNYDYLEGNWLQLYSYADRLPAVSSGTTQRLLDVSPRKTDGPFGMRYTGYLQAPATGVYTFHAPDEFVKRIAEPGYDLRLYINGEEWDLGQSWHGRGQWSVPLKAGHHTFMVTFADARAKDIEKQKSDAWAGFPTPWVVWRGTAPVIEISGPGIDRQPIPDTWLARQP